MQVGEFKKKFEKVFKRLNDYLEGCVQEAAREGGMAPTKQVAKIVGQMALLLAELPFAVTTTMDLDVISPIQHIAHKKLKELLLEEGMGLETDGHLIWMPKDTHYEKLWDFPWVEVWLADCASIIASKYRFKRSKDQRLIQTYLEFFPAQKEAIQNKAKGA